MYSSAEWIQQFLTDFKKSQLQQITANAENGDAIAQLQLGVLYANGLGVTFDDALAREWLGKAASQGEVAAMTLLGWVLVQDADANTTALAMGWYQQAAEKGDVDAQCAIADLHMQAIPGIEPNAKAMLYWYEQAAHQHHPKAQYQLGKMFADGRFIEQNDAIAFHWLTFAILNGSELAQKELAMLTARMDPAQVQTLRQEMMDLYQASH